jgi:hypothetical protein
VKPSCLLLVLILSVAGAAQTKTKSQAEADAEKVGISGARSVRDDKLNDPESFRVSNVRIVPNKNSATVLWVCIDGRAKNASGGYMRLLAVAIGLLPQGKAVAIDVSEEGTGYQIHCSDPGLDVTEVVKAALKADRDNE